MHPLLFRYYEDELRHLRELGAEFAEDYPKIASRLVLEKFECADPYVERLLEGVAFLTARIQLKQDARFPRFTSHLLEAVYPHYVAPTPSMAVVQFQPDLTAGSLAAGFPIPRGDTVLRSIIGKGLTTPCEYRTAHDVTLWPLVIERADYLASPGAVAALDLGGARGARAGLRLRFRTTAGLTFDQLALDRLPVFLRGSNAIPAALLEQMLGNAIGVVVRPAARPAPWADQLPASAIARCGYTPQEALLPPVPRSFDGYRLFQEFFAFPERIHFVELRGLAPSVRRCQGTELEVVVLFDRANPRLESGVDQDCFALFCSPAVNLFPKRMDRIHLNTHDTQFHVVPDRTRPVDFEVHSVLSVFGHGAGPDAEQEFKPFYALSPHGGAGGRGYYTVAREPRVLTARQRRMGSRSSYVGNEVYLSLVDDQAGAYRHDLRQLAVTALCTNRDLPLHMPIGRSTSDFTMDQGAPVESIRCLAGPSKPRASPPAGSMAWRLISHLSLNYLSLADSSPAQGAAALRDLLMLYAEMGDPSSRQQIEGVRSVRAQPVVRRVPRNDAILYARGQQVEVTFDEHAFEGAGIFPFGSVLEEFFAKYVSLNSFTETVIRSLDRGEVMRWPVRIGRREML